MSSSNQDAQGRQEDNESPQNSLENKLIEAAFNYGADQYEFHKDDAEMIRLMKFAQRLVDVFNDGLIISKYKQSISMFEMFRIQFDQMRATTKFPETQEEILEVFKKATEIVNSKPVIMPEIKFSAYSQGAYDRIDEELYLKIHNLKNPDNVAPLSKYEQEMFDNITRNFSS